MISRLKGIVVHRSGMEVVVDCQGVGYSVNVPMSTMEVVPMVGESVTLHTILSVREDAMQLFGFFTESEREGFKLLTSIQGIGGRIALGILSATTLDALRSSVMAGNILALQRLPGVGKKTAERMVVELRDKIVGVASASSTQSELSAAPQAADDAINALQALGYTRVAAEKAVKTVLQMNSTDVLSSEAIIKAALKQK